MTDGFLNAFDMGKYGFYVWTSYAVTTVVLGIGVIGPYLRLRALRRQIRETIKQQAQGEGAQN